MNYLEVKPNPHIVKENFETTLHNCRPRPCVGSYSRPKSIKEKIPWSIPISLFKDYQPDTEVFFKNNIDVRL